MNPRHANRRFPAALLAVAFFVIPADAAGVQTRTVSTVDQFARGSFDSTAIDSSGAVRLAPAARTIWGPAEGIVWEVVPAGTESAFVALSGPGRLLRVGDGGEAETWFESDDDTLVTALVGDGGTGAIIGLSPDVRILHAVAEDDVEQLAELDAVFVWAIEHADDGGLWVGTGVPGRLVHVDPEGGPTTLFEDDADPVRCVASHPDGGSVFGTGARGRVLRLVPDGRPFVLLDVDEAEIVDLVVAPDGTVYALAARGAKQPAGGKRATPDSGLPMVGAMRVEVTAEAPERPADERRTAAEERPRVEPQSLKGQPGGALYRIDPDGSDERIWHSEEVLPFALVLGPQGNPWIATGDGGRVFVVDPRGRTASVSRIASNQASAMRRAADGPVFVGGTTDARVEILGPEPSESGSYSSSVLDAGSHARWGHLRWGATRPDGARVTVSVRSGNTAEPDSTWSDWSEVRAADPLEGGPTSVTPARWFQAKFELTAGRGGSPKLHWLEVRYLPRNRAPRIDLLQVEPAGVAWLRGPAQASGRLGPVVVDDPIARETMRTVVHRGVRGSPIRKTYEAGARTLTWSADDPDGDRLEFQFELRREGESAWFPLAHKIEEEFYSWDTRGLPDGLYRARLIAVDAPDNPEDRRLSGERVSDVFAVDNRRPTIERFRASPGEAGIELRFVARDPDGAVAAVEIAVDGGDWRPLDPLDGVADFEEETYRVMVASDGENGTARTVLLRATDSSGNVGGGMWTVGGE